MMELGALICTPREPACSNCPIHKSCAAFRENRVAEFPRVAKRPKARQRRFIAVILWNEQSVLIRKRAREAVNGGLWEFPNFEAERGVGIKRQISAFLGTEIRLRPLAEIQHTITNNRITLAAYAGEANDEKLAGRLDARWTDVAELAGLPWSSAHGKLREIIQETARRPRPHPSVTQEFFRQKFLRGRDDEFLGLW